MTRRFRNPLKKSRHLLRWLVVAPMSRRALCAVRQPCRHRRPAGKPTTMLPQAAIICTSGRTVCRFTSVIIRRCQRFCRVVHSLRHIVQQHRRRRRPPRRIITALREHHRLRLRPTSPAVPTEAVVGAARGQVAGTTTTTRRRGVRLRCPLCAPGRPLRRPQAASTRRCFSSTHRPLQPSITTCRFLVGPRRRVGLPPPPRRPTARLVAAASASARLRHPTRHRRTCLVR
jgi:hypothetical protein